MDHDELREHVRALRAKGHSSKEIARALGIRPAATASIVRTIAAEGEAQATIECWVSPGWSAGLTIPDHLDWPDAVVDDGAHGLVNVLVARKERGSKVSLCGYLVDVYCLGLKNVIGPRIMNSRAAAELSDNFFSRYSARPLSVPLAMAQDLVFGAVEFARGLGFRPHADFDAAKGHLEPWMGPSSIGFGRDGKPLFIAGPYDNTNRILTTLEQSVGPDNFDYVVGVSG